MSEAGISRDQLQRLYDELGVTWHAAWPLPSEREVSEAWRNPERRPQFIEYLQNRQRRIVLSETDPLNYGFELPTWEDADRLLGKPRDWPGGRPEGELSREELDERAKIEETVCGILGIFGGNRAGKTWYAIKRICQLAETCPKARLVIMSESKETSVATVQQMVWFYFKPKYKHLNGKRDEVYKINYGQANGFTEGKLVLPNESEIYFLTYNQEVTDYEGWEFGAPVGIYNRVMAERRAQGLPWIPNIGGVCDESMPLNWMQMYARRIKFRKAKLLWPFTPINGITPAIKEFIGSGATTVASKPAELLPRQNLPDVPKGHMPYIRKCTFKDSAAIYFHTCLSPFGPEPGRTYWDEIKAGLEGKASEIIERIAYGYARDSMARAFRKFGPWNIVKRRHLPAVRTNYQFNDPAGARKWFMFWVGVTPSGDHYIYRDWPDAQTYGEWAVATEREVNSESRKGWDGDMGPAQMGAGHGVIALKEIILSAEDISHREAADPNADPYRARLARSLPPDGSVGIRERIEERFIDPRAGASEHMAEQGGTCIVDEFAEEQRDSKGQVRAVRMDFTPASGVGRRAGSDESEGMTLINELLDWNQEEPLCPVINAPKLFVCEDCLQVIWMFENFTGLAGEKGACKDPADLARYMALAKLEYVPEGGRGMVKGRGF